MHMQAAALAGGTGRMRQQLQQHLATLASFRGRTPGSSALALPPIGGLQDDTDGEPEVSLWFSQCQINHDICLGHNW